MNALVARNEGDKLVPEHDEESTTSAGHEELYVILSGTARFTVDGETFEAPERTVVAVLDPAVRRSAQEVSTGTTLLAVGAKPGVPFAVSGWDTKWTSQPPQAEESR